MRDTAKTQRYVVYRRFERLKPPLENNVLDQFSLLLLEAPAFGWLLAALVLFSALLAVIALRAELRGMTAWFTSRRAARKRAALSVRLLTLIESINEVAGRIAAWSVLIMMLVQVALIVMRYVFAVGSIAVQESIWYLHCVAIALGVGYTLAREGHVRLDILFRRFTPRTRAWINLTGVLLALLPLCAVTVFYGWGFVSSAWAVRESSAEVGGLALLWLLKSSVLAFAALLATQGIAMAMRSIHTLCDVWPGDIDRGDS